MAAPLSIRFRDDVLARLRRQARARGDAPSALAQRLVDEGLRSAEHPGIVFRDGPSGRRAGLASGPDVAEVIETLRQQPEQGQTGVRSAAGVLTLRPAQVQAALAYYRAFPAEVDAELLDAEAALDSARRQLLPSSLLE